MRGELETGTDCYIDPSQGGGVCGVMVIVAGYGHGDTSSNPGPD